jgi:hypothetical protein
MTAGEMFQTQIDFLWNNSVYSMPEHVTLLRDVLAKGGLTEGKNSWLKGEERKREEEEMVSIQGAPCMLVFSNQCIRFLCLQMLDLKIGEAIVASEATREEWWGQEKGGDVGRGDIHRRDKLRLSGVIGCDVARINRFLDAYAQSCAVHSMLQRRKGRGLPLPEGEERVSEVLREERGGEGKAASSSRKTAMQAQMGNVRTTRSMLKKL